MMTHCSRVGRDFGDTVKCDCPPDTHKNIINKILLDGINELSTLHDARVRENVWKHDTLMNMTKWRHCNIF